ncbi:hypothetical protein J2I47_05060 [Fibrella sp. HMF5335]|uniref:Uncharacterized protein n=1 Tax=Fibrella rubiginis TaxID=2817060 RepID=A0A939GFM9_9BACT|nr:hypothetical protein [Fibrella rubiginis]MBO0935910.1 hypothetical protein [Fibrella rubiginis]
MSNQLLIWYIGVAANVLPIVLGLWSWQRLNSPLRAIWGAFVVSGVLVISSLITRHLGITANALYYLGPVAYAWLYSVAFRSVVDNQRLQWPIRVFPVALMLLLGSMVMFRGVESFSVWGYVASDSWVICLSLVWFNEQLAHRPDQSLRATPWFWINMMLLLEKLYSLFFALTGQWLYGYHEQLFNVLLMVVSPLIIWGNALMACMGIWKQQQLTKQPAHQPVMTE